MSKSYETASLATLTAAAAYMQEQGVTELVAALSATLASATDAKETASSATGSLWESVRTLARITEESTGDDKSPEALSYLLNHVFSASAVLEQVPVENRESAAKSIKSYISAAGKVCGFLRSGSSDMDWSDVELLSYAEVRKLWTAENAFAEVAKSAATALRYIGKAGNDAHMSEARDMVQNLQALAARVKAEKKAKSKAGNTVASTVPAPIAQPAPLVVNG